MPQVRFRDERLGELRAPPPGTPVTSTRTTSFDLGDYLPESVINNASDLADATSMVTPVGPVLGMLRGSKGLPPGGPRLIPHPTEEGTMAIVDAAGQHLGKVESWLSKRGGVPEVVVKFLGLSGEHLPDSPTSQLGDYRKQIGVSGMRSIVEQLLEHYPEAKTLQRNRATGASAGRDPFKRFRLPRRPGEVDAPRAAILEDSAGYTDMAAEGAPPYHGPIRQEEFVESPPGQYGGAPFSERELRHRESQSLTDWMRSRAAEMRRPNLSAVEPGGTYEPGPQVSRWGGRESPPSPGPRREGDWYEFFRHTAQEPTSTPATRPPARLGPLRGRRG